MPKRPRKAAREAPEHTPLETPIDQPTAELTAPTVTAPQIGRQVADDTDFGPEKLEQKPFARAVRRADPFPSHGLQWPDGYRIGVQESDSRKTVEIQFGDGSRDERPLAMEESIKPFLKAEGMYWNGTNAWAINLAVPPKGRRESLAEQYERMAHNAQVRARVEDVILPAVVAMEEEKRGQIEVTDETRRRIYKARGGVGGPG